MKYNIKLYVLNVIIYCVKALKELNTGILNIEIIKKGGLIL